MQALDLLSTPGACTLTLTRHQVNHIYTKTGRRGETGVKDIVANGRVWPANGERGADEAVDVESGAEREAFWGEIPIAREFRAGFAIPTISLHASQPSLAFPSLNC